MKKVKKFLTSALCCTALSCTALLAACGVTVVEDPNAYTFTNKENPKAEADSDMTIDGIFDEARWSSVRWLTGVDRINSKQYAEIEFTTSYGENGVYFALRVEETGTNIWVNHNRMSYLNSCIEMYMGPATDGYNTYRIFEFDFQADGKYESRLNYNDWKPANTTYDKMPIIASQPLGGEVNTHECYGYTVEAFFPWSFLEFADYDVETQEERDALVLGIIPVHIFSFNYDGKNLNEDRYWSDWTTGYIFSQWLTPSSYFKFGNNGLIGYDYNVTCGGKGKGTVKDSKGLGCLLPGYSAEFTVTPVNAAKITRLTVNGEDYMGKLSSSGGSYTFTIPAPSNDVLIEVDFG